MVIFRSLFRDLHKMLIANWLSGSKSFSSGYITFCVFFLGLNAFFSINDIDLDPNFNTLAFSAV